MQVGTTSQPHSQLHLFHVGQCESNLWGGLIIWILFPPARQNVELNRRASVALPHILGDLSLFLSRCVFMGVCMDHPPGNGIFCLSGSVF